MEEELKHIITKVRDLYNKYGIKSVSMDDIARELGISKKTLYQHVEDKGELVKKVIEHESHSKNCFFNDLESRNLNSIEDILEVNRMISEQHRNHNPVVEYDLKKYYPDLYKYLKKLRREKMYSYVKNNLEKGKAEGLYRSEINSEIITKLYVSRAEALIDGDIFTSAELFSSEVFYEIFIYHLHGICNENGIKFLNQKLNELKNRKE